jgi:GNAT superfamily N-acetyltransferase
LTPAPVSIRYRSRYDDVAILEMDQDENYEPFVTGSDLTAFAAMPGATVWVAEREHEVVGFVCTLTQKKQSRIVKLIVSPPWRRQGVGKQLVAHLIERLGINKVVTLMATVSEDQLGAQLFFGCCGLQAEPLPGDHYLFTCSKQAKQDKRPGSIPLSLAKRITWSMP